MGGQGQPAPHPSCHWGFQATPGGRNGLQRGSQTAKTQTVNASSFKGHTANTAVTQATELHTTERALTLGLDAHPSGTLD